MTSWSLVPRHLTTIKDVPLAPADVTPGEILREEFLKPLGMTGQGLARAMGVDPMRVSEIIRWKLAVTAETASMLSAVLGTRPGTSPRFWLGLQNSSVHENFRDAARIFHGLDLSPTRVRRGNRTFLGCRLPFQRG